MAAQVTIARKDEKWVLLAAILASSMAFIDSTALNITLPKLQTDLGIGGGDLFWVINAYRVMLAALILISGVMGDRYGRKRVFAIGIVIFTVASVICGLATNGTTLIAARAAQGIGAALMTPGSLALLAGLFPENRRGAAIGTWSMFATLVSLFGPIAGGWLSENVTWRLIFFINVPLAAVALFVLLTRVPESKGRDNHAPLDWFGATLATIGLAALTYGFIRLGEGSGSDLSVPASLLVGVIALIAFAVLEMRIANPMLPPNLFRSPTFSGVNLLTLFLYGALGAIGLFLTLNLVQVQGYDATQGGLAFLPFGILLTILSPRMGKLADRVGARPLLIAGPAITGLGFALTALPGITNGVNDYWLTYFPAFVLMGIGMGITVAPLTTAVFNSAPRDAAGTASGVNNAVARAAEVLALAIFGAIVLSAFASQLDTGGLPLTGAERAQLMREAVNLGATEPPPGLPGGVAEQVSTAINWAFVQTYRLVALLSAALAWVAAGMAFWIVEAKRRR